ncbi:MAG: multidrug efflux SMR transporter [Pseudodesulfovibrio sp.]
MMGYLYLALAIIAEVVATTALQASDGFSKIIPNSIVVVGYGLAFYFLGLVLKSIPMGIAYAIWAGTGIVLISFAGIIVYRQMPDTPAMIGMGLIVAGVAVINLFSKTTTH